MKLLQKSLHQKIVIILTLLTLTSFIFAKFSYAVVAPGGGRYSNIYGLESELAEQEAVFDEYSDELSIHTFNAHQLNAVGSGLTAVISGANQDALIKCMQQNNCTGAPCEPCQYLVEKTGVVPVAAGLVRGVFERPNFITLAAYKNSVLANSFLGKTAYAQTGEGLLAPVLKIWQTMRNIAYFAFVAVLIAVGFMIMFRYKLGPQTNVTLMNALPKVALALVLVTFSYPIVVLFLDVTWMLIKAIASSPLSPGDLSEEFFDNVIAQGNFNVLGFLLTSFGAAITAVLIGQLLLVIGILSFFIALFGAVVNFIIRLAKILLMTAFAPLILAWGAIPGVDTTTGWLKGLAANCLSLVGILVFLMLGIYFWLQVPVSMVNAMGDLPGIPLISGMTGIILGVIVLFQSWKVPGVIDKALAGKGVPGWYTRGGGGGKK